MNNEVPISQAAGPIEIVLRDDGGSIEGDVVDMQVGAISVSAGILLIRNTSHAANQFSQPNGHFKLPTLAPGDYTIYRTGDEPNDVEYANPDWMRRFGGGGMAVTVTAGPERSSQVDTANGSGTIIPAVRSQRPA